MGSTFNQILKHFTGDKQMIISHLIKILLCVIIFNIFI